MIDAAAEKARDTQAMMAAKERIFKDKERGDIERMRYRYWEHGAIAGEELESYETGWAALNAQTRAATLSLGPFRSYQEAGM